MDLDPETVHETLVEVGLPSTVEDLKNPTQDYVVSLLTEFLHKLHIDVSAIKRPTIEQLTTLGLAEDNPEMVALVNITEAMASIGNFIYLKDFCLTDITSPVPKRTRRIAKLLVNFVLYSNNTMVNIENKLESTRLKVEELEALRERKNAIKEAKSQMALDYTKKLERKEQLQLELKRRKAKREDARAKAAELEASLKASEVEKLKLSQLQGNLKVKAIKMRKKTEELESKIVRSPRQYEARLEELMEQKEQHIEKREHMQEQIRSKKAAIEKIESHLSIVRQHHANFTEVTEAYKRLTEGDKEVKEVTKKVAEVRSNIEKEAAIYAQHNEPASNADVEKVKEQCKQSLSNIRNERAKLLNEKKDLEKALEDSLTRKQEMLSQIDKTRASTKQREDDMKSFLKNCQELYDAEVKKVRDMQNLFDGNVSNE